MSWFVTKDYYLKKTPQTKTNIIDLYDVDTAKAWSMLKNGMMKKQGFEAWFTIHSSIHKPIRDDKGVIVNNT